MKNKAMKRALIMALALVISSLISGCKIATKIPEEQSGIDTKIFFCPKQNCTQALEEALGSAEGYAYCAFFDLDLPEIVSVLKSKSKESDIRLMIDRDNDLSLIKGSSVHFDNSSAFMHDKFCVIDDITITTGSFNPTFNDAYKNNNNLVIINSRILAQNYKDEFLELWNYRKDAKTNTTKLLLNNRLIENYFCPEDNCAAKVQQRIRQANKSIYFMMFSFTFKPIINDLIVKKSEGLDIKGILEKSQSGNKATKEFLEFQGIDIIFDSNNNKLHHKVFIIDEKTVITGSFNPSRNANTRNDENIIIIDDEEIAKLFLEEFNKLYHNQA